MERSGTGVVYTAIDGDDRAAVLRSIDSLRRHSPDLAICVATGSDGVGGPLWQTADHPVELTDAHGNHRDRIAALLQRPFARTVSLSPDTIVRRPLEPLLELAAGLDVAGAPDTSRAWLPVDVPDAFGEIDTGVLLLGDRPAVDVLLQGWDGAYRVMSGHADTLAATAAEHPAIADDGAPAPVFDDQAPLRFVIWNAIAAGEIRFGPLPLEANLQLDEAAALGTGVLPWIVRGLDPDDLVTAADSLERHQHARVWLPGLSGGTSGRLADQLVVGGTTSAVAGKALAAADAARDATRRALDAGRRAVDRVR